MALTINLNMANFIENGTFGVKADEASKENGKRQSIFAGNACDT